MRHEIVLSLLALGGLVRAVDAAPTEPADSVTAVKPTGATELGRKMRVPMVVLEHAIMLGVPGVYYWNTIELQKEDWELGWSWSTWKTKLFTTDALVFDTNRFEPNGIRHALAGAMTYQIGRANGFGVLSSTVMNFGASWLWENVGEFRERPAINDLIVNTVSGILIGEPLFQIGKLADGQGGLMRRAVALATSPFSRAQKETGLSSLVDEVAPAHRIEMTGATNALRLDDERATAELRLGLDVELMKDRNFGLTGNDASWTGIAGWNRMAVDVKLADDPRGSVGGFRFRSSTTYAGRYARNIDDEGLGSSTFVGVGGAFHLHQRRLAAELDRYSVLSLVSPRAAGWVRSEQGEIDWEVAASGDVAMVQAHAFGLEPLMEDSSILLMRGYYYAPGASASARVRGRSGRFSAELESTAHQFWSFDSHSYGGENDPKDVEDQRVVSKAVLGVRPTSKDVRVELFADAVLRRGTWSEVDRRSTELAAGIALTAGL